MVKFKLLGAIILILFTSSILQGQVTLIFQDSISNEPIEQVFVQFFKSELSIEVYDVQVTDDRGKIEVNEVTDSMYFTATHLKYKELFGKVSASKCNPCKIYLFPSIYELPETQITARDQGVRVQGDTIRFDLSVFKNKSQKDLKDLIQTLPGMEIKANGGISYNNKKIDKILLSGKDVFRSQFDMLNRLVRKEMVETVQIIPGKKSENEEDPPQYLDIVLSKEHNTLANLGLGISHTKRAEQEGSILLTGDYPIQSFFNVVNRSLNRAAVSSGDRIRKTDFEIMQARSKLYNNFTFYENVPSIYQDGINHHDLFLQFNAQTNRDKFQATSYVDYQRHSYDLENSSRTINPINNQIIGVSNKKFFFSEEAFSTYYKQAIKFNPKHKITTFLSYDFQEEEENENGASSFYDDSSDFTSNILRKHQGFIFYNTYTYSILDDFQFELESDLNYVVDEKKLLINSSDTLFGFTIEEDENFIVEQLQNRSVFSAVFLPKFRYRINSQQDVSVYFQYQKTLLKDDSILFQDLEDSTFNANSSRSFIRYDSGITYKLKKDKFELLIKPSYTTFKSNDLNNNRNGAYNFLVRYRYNFSNYFSWINTLTKSFNRFSNNQFFQSAFITDNRNYTLYEEIEIPTFVQWNFSSTLRYVNTANGKICFVHFNHSNSAQSLIPKILISNNAQETRYIMANSINQFRVNGFLRWPLMKNNITTRFNFNKMNSFIADETGLEDLTTRQYILSSTFRSKIKENTTVNLTVGFNAISQSAGLINNSFTTVAPEIEVQQFIAPKFWIEIKYQPLIRIELMNQQLIDFSISTKFLKDKLNLKLTFSDVLNFNNPTFITRLISSNAINENITNRVGGYINLNVSYQFQ